MPPAEHPKPADLGSPIARAWWSSDARRTAARARPWIQQHGHVACTVTGVTMAREPATFSLFAPGPSPRIDRVLAAIDPSAESVARAVLDAAAALADAARAELFALHAWTAPGEALLAHYQSASRARAFVRDRRARAQRAFELLLETCRPVLDAAHRVLLRGQPDVVIPRAADELQIDAVLVGITPRSWLQRVMFGHTAEHIAPRLGCRLIVVSSPEHEVPRSLPRAVAVRGAA